MELIAATNWPPTVNYHKFVGLVIIVLLRLVTAGDDLPPTHDYNPCKYVYCSEKENVLFHIYVHALLVNDSEVQCFFKVF